VRERRAPVAARVRASFERQGFMRSLGAELTALVQQTLIRMADRPDTVVP
jgi:hypothetical protein